MALQGGGHVGISNYLKNTVIPSLTTVRATNIYDNELTDLAGFPAVTITSLEKRGRFLDNARDEVVIVFSVKIFIDRNVQNFGTSKAETILRSIADELITRMQSDNSLGGNCIWSKAFDAKYGYIDRENDNIRLVEVTLECHDANNWR